MNLDELYTKMIQLGTKITKDELEFSLLVDTLSIDERIELREFYLEQDKNARLPRNLFYNYKNQAWF